MDLISKLNSDKVLIADGATATNLQMMGLPIGAAAEVMVMEQPDAVQRLHLAFIEAGAQIVLTCTFGGTRLRLKDFHLADHFEEVNRRAVRLAQAAADGTDVLIAGVIGSTGHMLDPFGDLSEEEAEHEFKAHAQTLCEAGVDFLVIETQFDINEAAAAVRGVRAVSAVMPLVVSFSYDRGIRTMMDISPAQMAATFNALPVDVLGINCGRSLSENLEVLRQLRESTDKPIWFKPSAGLPDIDRDGNPTYAVTPEEMGSLVDAWIKAGAAIVGGCCGTTPDHLAAIAKNVSASRISA